MPKGTSLTLVLGAALAFGASVGNAQVHPRYLHARTDLRTAQWVLREHDEPNVMRHVRRVDAAIDAAVVEIDRAAVVDHKDIVDHPPIDTGLDRRGRFGKAMELLRRARADIEQEEDRPRARVWRNRAFGDIDEAIRQLKEAAATLRLDHLEGF